MSVKIDPAEIDIEYLYQHCKSARLPMPTESDEMSFVELCGKNVSDGMTDLVARIKAFEVYAKGHRWS